MNLYLRFLLLLISMPFLKKSKDLKWMEPFRVWPQDIDINLHLTNARYFSFADLARTYALARFGILRQMVKKGWLPVVNAEEITFFRPIAPFARLELRTELVYWDEKYFYMQHEYWSKGKICAKALIRGVFYNKKHGVISLDRVLALAGITDLHFEEPDTVHTWKAHLNEKKKG